MLYIYVHLFECSEFENVQHSSWFVLFLFIQFPDSSHHSTIYGVSSHIQALDNKTYTSCVDNLYLVEDVQLPKVCK